MANRESRSSWKDFLLGLRRRGFNGVEFVVADDHAGLRVAIREVLPEGVFQRNDVAFRSWYSWYSSDARAAIEELQRFQW